MLQDEPRGDVEQAAGFFQMFEASQRNLDSSDNSLVIRGMASVTNVLSDNSDNS